MAPLFCARSWFTLRQGRTPIPALVQRAAAAGYTALTLADQGGLYGAPAFVRACREAGIKPILGCTLPVDGAPVTFVATSPTGYASLCRLVTGLRVLGTSAAPGPGIVALVSRPMQAAHLAESCPTYVALDSNAPDAVNSTLVAAGLPVIAVATGDAPPPPSAWEHAFAWCPQALAASQELVEGCVDPWPAPEPRLPQFPGDLRTLARAGLAHRYGPNAPYDRLELELAVIERRGQAGYFLALWDLVRYARRESIPVGPGRGSAVGSLTAYALGITGIDPLAHRLYFERFLNPERPDLPDIDLDVCSHGRARLLAYLRHRHGPERVAHVGVLTTLGARGAVREAGRRLGTPRGVVDQVAGVLPHEGSIAAAVARLPEFRYIDITREPVRSLLRAAQELEGRPWHPSVHAAGLVIAPEPLSDLVPLERAAGGEVITQYSAGELAELGLVKIDILGLRNLTVIAAAAHAVEVSPETIPPADPKTYALLAAGETLGVFQLDSPGIRNLLRQLRPENMDDLIAVLSLYRPGPFAAGVVETFIRRRRRQEQVRHLHPALALILDETYGILVYQEQAMRIAHEVGRLSLAAADQLRRALAKGDASAYHERFCRGAARRGIPPRVADQIFAQLERFSGYSFNKAHTAAYALLSYQTAYLKAHHPATYFAALLAHESGYFAPHVYTGEAERLGVRFLPPDVNRSLATYAVAGADTVRAGLLQVKGVGPGMVAAILTAREQGPFRSMADFQARLPARHLRPQTLAALRIAGAFAGLPAAPAAAPSSPVQLTLFDCQPAPPRDARLAAATSATSGASPEALPIRQVPAAGANLKQIPHGGPVRLSGPIITCQRRPVGDELGLTMLLQVGAEQVEVLVSPTVYARDLLAIDPAGVTVEGQIQRRGVGMRVIAGAIRPAV